MKSSLLPESIRDLNNEALEECMKSILDIDTGKFMVYPLENASERVLDELSKEYHIEGFEGWHLANSREEKINLIKNSIPMHAKKGSVYSIKEALELFGIDCEIKEFFEYGGRPAHFRVEYLNLFSRGLDEELESMLSEIIENYKPKTRKLDRVNYFLGSKGAIYTVARVCEVENVVFQTKEAIGN